MTALLEIKDLKAAYGSVEVLHGVALNVPRGGVIALLGANGAGKTTTLRAICRMMVSTRGSVQFDGVRIDGWTTSRIAHVGVGHVPDGRGTFLSLSTEENLRLGAHASPEKSYIASDMKRIYDYFPRLWERRNQQAGTMSGGEQQMLAIGRALMGRPKLLLLDEPSFGLAPMVVRDIFAILRRLNTQEGASILLVEQNAKLALEISSYAYLMETGRIVLSGPSADLQRDEMVRRVYLGV